MTGVLVVGSLHHDILVDAPALPRLGETLAGSAWAPKFGGKGGNQALAAAAAGARVRMLGAIGDDEFGAYLRAGLEAGRVDHAHVRALPGAGSGMSVAIREAGGDYGAVIVSGANLHLDPGWLDEVGVWDGVTVLLLQNEVPEAANSAAARIGRARGVRVILNAAPFRPLAASLLALTDVLVVNAIEAAMLGAAGITTLADATRAAETLLPLAPRVVVTAGPAGAALAGRDGARAASAAETIRVSSTHGAGDCFAGCLGAALARAEPEAAALAAAVAAATRFVASPSARRPGRAPRP